MRREAAVWVDAPARLHLGFIDLRGDLGRRFGGVGIAVRSPSLLLEARPAADLSAEGEDADRVLRYARRFLDHHGIRGGAAFRVHRAIPPHSGLGSGTQLALATARALASLYGLGEGAHELAAAVGRARRSAIGTWTFAHGGFILEGGRRRDSEDPAPLLLRRAVPASWRCVIAIPRVDRGLSGEVEEQAFRTLPPPPPEQVGEISRLILMVLLPSLVEGDLEGFGRAVTEIQRRVGETFRAIQGAVYAHPLIEELVEAMLTWGAAGAGQSSWGPAVYGFVDGEEAASSLTERLKGFLGERGTVFATTFDNRGARFRLEGTPAAVD